MNHTRSILTVALATLLTGCVAPQPQAPSRPPARTTPQVQRRMEPPSQPSGTAVFKAQNGQPFQLEPAADEETPVNTLTKGTVTLRDKETGQMQVDPQIKIVERWGAVNGLRDITFVCSPTNGQVSFTAVKDKVPTYATLQFLPPDRWKILDGHFYFLTELVQTGALTTQSILGKGPSPVGVTINDERSITRASVVNVPEGEYMLFGYKIQVPSQSGRVTFRLGKIITHENCRIVSGQ